MISAILGYETKLLRILTSKYYGYTFYRCESNNILAGSIITRLMLEKQINKVKIPPGSISNPGEF